MPFFRKNVSQEQGPTHFAILLHGLQLKKKTFQVQVLQTAQREKKVVQDTTQNCKKCVNPTYFQEQM